MSSLLADIYDLQSYVRKLKKSTIGEESKAKELKTQKKIEMNDEETRREAYLSHSFANGTCTKCRTREAFVKTSAYFCPENTYD